ncbi:deoxyribonuclease IV [Enorma burkinafasonensis]|uniref:deoxyribonuclease IV n=1 Tax=Enorma burkinafasonensis TaxID=2590867 RepID=UPI0011A06A7C|nr:deoxyribonuclease IV [Enorma burkinafasonensis]
MLTIGCHLSISNGFAAMGETALSIGANTFAFFTRNPRGGSVRALDLKDVAALACLMERHGFGPLVAHAPYAYNPCSAKEHARAFALEAMRDDLERLEALPGNLYNFHPGAHTGQGPERGIELIVDTLCQVMFPGQRTTVLLETMAGKGTEVGRSFEELAAILDAVERRRGELAGNLGVCLDTCHVSDAGYDIVHDLDGVLAAFDRTVGLERLRAVHLNDSKNPCGARKDRHARIGEGYLGCPELGGSEEALAAIVRHPALRTLPFILETPNELPGYAREIALMRRLAGDA